MHVPMREFQKHWDALAAGEFLGEGPFAKKPEKGKGFLGVAVEGREGQGVRVRRVGRESPAERAGIKSGDILLKMDGEALDSEEQFADLLKEKAPVDSVAFEMLRNGKTETLTLRLADRDG
jgi:serine protease Do